MRKESDFNYAPEVIKEEWDSLVEEISDASTKVDRSKFAHFNPKFLDTVSSDYDVDLALRNAEDRRQMHEESTIFQLEGSVKIDTEMPITITPIGDAHLFKIYSNINLFKYVYDKVLNTPGHYTILMHNLVDNANPTRFPHNAIVNTADPMTQFAVMQKMIKELDDNDKILGATWSGCHEGWSWSVAGIEAEKLLYGYEGRKFPILENGGLLHLDVGEQEYTLGLWHKQGPYNSNFNDSHALKQNRRLVHESQTDIEIGAHYHRGYADASWEGTKGWMKQVNYIGVGTFVGVPFLMGSDPTKWDDAANFITDRWIAEKRGVTGEPPGASVMLWDKRKMVDNTLDFDTAVEKHMAIRTYALVKEMGLEERFANLMK